jgi:hypothetical protein
MTMCPMAVTRHASRRCPIVLDVLDDLVEQDDVKSRIDEGKALGRGEGQVWQRPGAPAQTRLLDVDAVDPVRELPQLANVGPNSAATSRMRRPSRAQRRTSAKRRSCPDLQT